MTASNLGRVRELAAAFRDAIERCDRSSLPLSFEAFPCGSCGDVTNLLGKFLIEQGAGAFRYICGERGNAGADWHSHAWLEADGVIVDITADQFPEVTEKVFVSTQSEWHATFRQEPLHQADYQRNDEPTFLRLAKAYRVIVENIKHGAPAHG